MAEDRIEVQRTIPAPAAAIFRVLCEPSGHVAIDSSGMLMDAEGSRVTGVGDTFVVHMDREALGDMDLGRYDVTVTIETFEPDREISWSILGVARPKIDHRYGYRLEPTDDGGTVVTSFYDWSQIHPDWKGNPIFPVVPASALKASLGILERVVAGRMAGAERFEVQRPIAASPAALFEVLADPRGHVAIDSSGMLIDADGGPVTGVGDEFVVHMDRESLGDVDLGRYDVTVIITTFEPDREIAWTIKGRIRPQIGHVYGYRLEPTDDGTLVTSYYDWSDIHPEWKQRHVFPVVPTSALKATLGILERVVTRPAYQP